MNREESKIRIFLNKKEKRKRGSMSMWVEGEKVKMKCVSGVVLGWVGLYRIDGLIYRRHLFIEIRAWWHLSLAFHIHMPLVSCLP
jgi:hypothetical protein